MKKVMIAVMLMLVCSIGFAQNYIGADSAEAFQIKYIGSGGAATSVWAATTLTLTATDLAGGGTISLQTQTVAGVISDLYSATNSSSQPIFKMVKWGSIGTDATSNQFITATNVLQRKQWTKVGKWDTSAHLSYNVVPGYMNSDRVETDKDIHRIYGEPDGTGNVTLRIYEADTEKWKQTITSPVYVMPSVVNGGGLYTNTTDNVVTLDEEVNFPTASSKRYLIRATRATTATTGALGVMVERP